MPWSTVRIKLTMSGCSGVNWCGIEIGLIEMFGGGDGKGGVQMGEWHVIVEVVHSCWLSRWHVGPEIIWCQGFG